jgi:hypothetical protein
MMMVFSPKKTTAAEVLAPPCSPETKIYISSLKTHHPAERK